MLGFLLARAGVEVEVLEKHADFLRDFRGDTVHPSTLELLFELGLLDQFLALPHQELSRLQVAIGDRTYDGPDFAHLKTRCKFIALMPQWDFLDFLARQGRRYPNFHLRMSTEVTDLLEEGGRVVGVRARTEQGELSLRADLVVATDGRHSTVRERAGLERRDFGVPIDALWYRLTKRTDEPSAVLGRMRNGRLMVTIDRGDYFQCGSIIPKGAFDRIRSEGLDAFRAGIVGTAPACSASATRPTPCRPPEGSASTSPCRTPWPPPTCSPTSPVGERLPRKTSPPSSTGAKCQRGESRRRRSSSIGACSARAASPSRSRG